MKTDIKIPSMGESITEATIGQIIKASGTKVSMDDEILELETDKVNQVLYAQQSGTIVLNVSKGDVVKIGQVIGHIDSEGKEETKKDKKQENAPQTLKNAPAPPASSKSVRITKEEELSSILSDNQKPSEEGKIEKEPLAIPELSSNQRKETRQKMSRIRQVIAKRLVEAQHNAAMLTTFNEVDMSQVIQSREKYKEVFLKQYGVKLGFMPFFVKAAVESLKTQKGLNSYIEGDEIVHREYYDIGVAVSTDRGLVVPIIRECDKLSFFEIEKAIDSHAKRAREGGLSVDDLQGGGFTITNGGVYGSLLSTPILNPPQSGILGMHKIQKRPVVVDDQIVIRPMMYIALSYDHRIVDGKEAVTFLVSIKNFLEDPARMFLQI